MIRSVRIVVLGLGGLGSAAAYWSARRFGSDVVGIEQFPFGHHRGGSEDHSRIIRLSYHTPDYVRFAAAAYEAWDTLEAESGDQVVLRTGGLDLAPTGSAIELDPYRQSLDEVGVAYEFLDAAGVMERWPQWKLPDHVTAIFQEQSGIAMATRANAAHRAMAREYGARLLENTPVRRVEETPDGVVVETDDEAFLAERLIVAAGAWTNRTLEMLGTGFSLQVSQEQVVYLGTSQPASFHPRRFPIWIWMDEPCFYGFGVFGRSGVKVAWDRCEVFTDVDSRSFEPRQDVIDGVGQFVAKHLPGIDGPVLESKTCLYTLTPDRDFVLGRAPETERVIVAVGAGHAFKFASVIGEALSDLAADGATRHDISAFDPVRPVLTEPNPMRSYMV